MFIKNQFIQNKLVLHLMEQEEFELLTASSNQEEYLLWRTNKRNVDIVRVSLKQYDWNREVEAFVQQVEKNVVQNIQLPLFKQSLSFHHVFIVEYEPVDSWSNLMNRESTSNKIDNSLVYLCGQDRDEVLTHFFQKAQLHQPLTFSIPDNLFELEYQTETLKHKIQHIKKDAEKAILALFNRGKPRLSYLILVINIIIFILLEYRGGSINPETLIQYGAKYNVAMLEGEWWRIITSMFLHIGIFHLVLNMLALYFIGTLVERIYGNVRFVIIYFLAGIAGGMASFALNPSIAAGASGALFGLFGALLYFGLKNPKVFFKTMGTNVIFIVIINIIFGFSVPQVDNAAHIGGLMGGFIASGIVMLPKTKAFMQQLIAVVVYVFYLFGLLAFGLTNEDVQYDETLQIQHIQQLLEEKQYQEVTEIVSRTLPYADQLEAELLFYRAYANIYLESFDIAKSDLETAVQHRTDFEEAWYNLAILYQQENEYDKALQAMEQLLDLNNGEISYQTLYQELKEAEAKE
ncbi:rhomboid family intramembrane serine protease [Gracilibacillus lacisalsi]|uniref:rhomboid family intramembrane serine protease n=1 Tax=Gracilibacillus lacisalsi TaxID=393087 RepID=UPI000374C0D1|nr:rhomboid family intramembrane serine protease [Gracilibacillus lacisalsi]